MPAIPFPPPVGGSGEPSLIPSAAYLVRNRHFTVPLAALPAMAAAGYAAGACALHQDVITGAAVAVGGIIAFVGMVVPQIARRLVGPDHRRLLPTAMLFGGLVLVGSDWLSRVYLAGLDIGVITSLLGAPVFCWLLRRRMTQGY